MMQQPCVDIRPVLEALHFKAGKFLVLCSRTLAMIIAIGSFFCLMLLGGLLMTRHPERILQLESFHFNYNELNRVQRSVEASHATPDPNWDGAAAGFGVGVEAGRVIPIVGVVAGPMLGALMGYELDRRVNEPVSEPPAMDSPAGYSQGSLI